MTTNNIKFKEHPYAVYNKWKAAFRIDRTKAPIFVRAGSIVNDPVNPCRTSGNLNNFQGCGQPCTFCMMASDGSGCGGSGTNDVSMGIGLNPTFCGGGDSSKCSSSGQWSRDNRVLIWAKEGPPPTPAPGPAPAVSNASAATHYNIYATGGSTIRKKIKVIDAASPTSNVNVSSTVSTNGITQTVAGHVAFVTGLKQQTSYTFEVTAVNQYGESDYTTPSASVTSSPVQKRLFVSDYSNDRVLRFDYDTRSYSGVFVAKGSGGLSEPRGIAFNPFDDADQPRTFYVSSEGTDNVLMYDACDGSFVRSFATISGRPSGLLFKTLPSKHKPPRQQKMLLVSDYYNNRIAKINALTGSPLGTFVNVQRPGHLLLDPSGNEILVANGIDRSLMQYDVNGTLKLIFKETGKTMAFAPVTVVGGSAGAAVLLSSVGRGNSGGTITKFDSATGAMIKPTDQTSYSSFLISDLVCTPDPGVCKR